MLKRVLSSTRADPFSQVCQPRAPRLGARCASHVPRTGRGARVRARSATSPPPAAPGRPGLCPTRASGAAVLPAASGGNRKRKDPLPCRRPRPSRGARALARERWREEGRSEPGRGGHQDAKPATAGSPLLSFPPGFGPEIETMAIRLRCRARAAGPNEDTWGAKAGTGRALASRGSPAAFISQALRLASPRGPSGMCRWSGMWKPAARYTDVETRHQLARMLTLARRGPP